MKVSFQQVMQISCGCDGWYLRLMSETSDPGCQTRQPGQLVLKLRCSRVGGDQPGENRGNSHHPTRQQGISPDTGQTRQLNPSLTFRGGRAANAQIENQRERQAIVQRSAAILSLMNFT